MAMHEDSDNQLAVAENVYNRILQGRHPGPDAGFELIRALLHDAGYSGQFNRIDETLPEDPKEAENHIISVVIPRSYLLLALRKFQEYQPLKGGENTLQAIARRDELEALLDQSGYPVDFTKSTDMDKVLAGLCERHSDVLNAGASLSSEHMMDGFLQDITQSGSWVERISRDKGIISEIKHRDTVSLDVVLRHGVANTPKDLKAHRKKLREIAQEHGIQCGVAAYFDPDRAEQTITLTVDPAAKDKLGLVLKAFEKGNKERGGIGE